MSALRAVAPPEFVRAALLLREGRLGAQDALLLHSQSADPFWVMVGRCSAVLGTLHDAPSPGTDQNVRAFASAASIGGEIGCPARSNAG